MKILPNRCYLNRRNDIVYIFLNNSPISKWNLLYPFLVVDISKDEYKPLQVYTITKDGAFSDVDTCELDIVKPLWK